jgi:transcriptional regulator with XRE-family HTH domain
MYQQIWKDYKTDFFKRNPRFPREKSFSVGRALWAISRQKRIKFIEVAQKTGMLEGSILRMSSSHKLTSTPERVKSLAHALGVDLPEFFRAAREEFFGNFFITKAIMPSDEETRGYARQGLFLQKQSMLKYPATTSPDFKVIVYTPPVESLDDFFSASILIAPGKALTDCLLSRPTTIHLAVINGSVSIKSETGEEKEAVAGQSALFNGGVKHSIANLSGDREAEILISISPTITLTQNSGKKVPKAAVRADLDIPNLIKQAQRWLAPSPENPMPLSELALLAGLETRDLGSLSKGSFSNYPLEKMERIAELLAVPIEELFKGSPFLSGLNIEIATGTERGAHDYRSPYGVMFYPWGKLGTAKKRLFLGQAAFETQIFHGGTGGNKTIPSEKRWEGKNPGYVLAKGLSGKFGIQTGIRHYYPDINREDTIYADMSLGFSLQNLSPAEPTNMFLVSSADLF